MNINIYDIAIIGGGPAGLTASIYALRSGRSVVLIEKAMLGGQSTYSSDINNFPAFESITGADLAMKMHTQAENLGLNTVYAEVTDLTLNDSVKVLSTTEGEIQAKVVILAMGAKARALGAKNEEKFIGAGVSYCAICDGAFYKGKEVVLIGNGNTAVEDAIYLSKICKKVTIINRSGVFKCQDILLQELNDLKNEYKNISVFSYSTVTEILGENTVTGVMVKNGDKVDKIECSGVFVAVGRIPDTEILKNKIDLDTNGYIQSNDKMQTNISGVYCAGDIRVKLLRQIITACADGAIAGSEASSYLK